MERTAHAGPDRKNLYMRQLIPLVLFMSAVASACSERTPSPQDVAMYKTIQASSRDIATQNASSRQTLQSRLVTPSPTPIPRRDNPNAPLMCGQVAETNGSVFQALYDANNRKNLPAHDGNGAPYYVAVDHKNPATLTNTRYLTTVLLLLNSGIIVEPGDRVCFSTDSYKLNNIPTPTSGPRMTPTPSAYRYNNTRNQSFAVSANRQAFVRRG